jgi:hypothetical protein
MPTASPVFLLDPSSSEVSIKTLYWSARATVMSDAGRMNRIFLYAQLSLSFNFQNGCHATTSWTGCDNTRKAKNASDNSSMIERKKILSDSVREGAHVILSIFVEDEGKEYYEAAVKKVLNVYYETAFGYNSWHHIALV